MPGVSWVRRTVIVSSVLLVCYQLSDHAASGYVTTPRISLVAVGDVMVGSSFNFGMSTDLPRDQGRGIFTAVLPYLRGDIVFGNLEGAIGSEEGLPTTWKPKAYRSYAFRMPPEHARRLAEAGFNLMSVANNHSNDFGPAGQASTGRMLEGLGIQYAGFAGTKEEAVFSVKGLRIGFLAVAPENYTGVVDMLNHLEVVERVRKLKRDNDIVIVSFHGGREGPDYQHVPYGMEMFQGVERGNLRKFSHDVIDAGADLVLGHGPHVTRAFEIYKCRFIAYSLGNFATAHPMGVAGETGIAPLLRLELSAKGDFVSGRVVPIQQRVRAKPIPDENKTVYQVLNRLIKEDFPESDVRVQEDGRIDTTACALP